MCLNEIRLGIFIESPFSLRVGPERSPGKKMPVDSNKSTQKSTSSFKTQQDHFKLRDHDISAESEFIFRLTRTTNYFLFDQLKRLKRAHYVLLY